MERRDFAKLLGAGLGWTSVSSFLAACGDTNNPVKTPLHIEPIIGELPTHERWWLSGNYAPVPESESLDLDVIGEIPPELNGTYIRNGPNPVTGESPHWFAGDGMLHAVRIEGGKAPWYRARYVETEFLKAPPEPGSIPGVTNHQANTSIIQHANRRLCLAEGGLPYEVDSELSTTGVYTYEDQLDGPMTAHPKIDPETGELHFFGYNIFPPSVDYYVADASGSLTHSTTIEIPAGTMVHDFQLTETHVIFMDLPLLFNLELAIAGDTIPFRWEPTHQARIGLLPRGEEGVDIQWFNIDPCFVFHTINAYNDSQNPEEVVLRAVRYPDFWDGQTNEFGSGGEVWEWRINTVSGSVTDHPFTDHLVEFPVINPNYQGVYNQYGFAIGPPDAESEYFSALIKYDFEQGTQSVTPLSVSYQLGEMKFIPMANATAEDHGWLVGYGFDPMLRRSALIILDAADTTGVPVAQVIIPTRIPFGFHGDWFPN